MLFFLSSAILNPCLQDAEAIRKRQAAEELVFAAPDPRRGLHNDVDYDEDDPEAFLVRQVKCTRVCGMCLLLAPGRLISFR